MNSGKESNLHHAILIKEERVLLLDFDILKMFPDIYIYIHHNYISFLSKVPKDRSHSFMVERLALFASLFDATVYH